MEQRLKAALIVADVVSVPYRSGKSVERGNSGTDIATNVVSVPYRSGKSVERAVLTAL